MLKYIQEIKNPERKIIKYEYLDFVITFRYSFNTNLTKYMFTGLSVLDQLHDLDIKILDDDFIISYQKGVSFNKNDIDKLISKLQEAKKLCLYILENKEDLIK